MENLHLKNVIVRLRNVNLKLRTVQTGYSDNIQIQYCFLTFDFVILKIGPANIYEALNF